MTEATTQVEASEGTTAIDTGPLGTASSNAAQPYKDPYESKADSKDESPEIAADSDSTDDRVQEEQSSGIDLSGIPEEQHELAKSLYTNINGQVQSNFTRRHQEFTAKEKILETQQAQSQRDLQQWDMIAKDVLKNGPERIGFWAEQYGLEGPKAEAEVPEFNTVGEMMAYQSQKLDQKLANERAAMKEEMQNLLVQTQGAQKWDGAIAEARKDATFANYELEILTRANSDPKYQGVHNTHGPKGVLEAATLDFKEKLRGDIERGKQEALKSFQTKKAANTTVPGRNVQQVDNVDRTNMTYEQKRDLAVSSVRNRYG